MGPSLLTPGERPFLKPPSLRHPDAQTSAPRACALLVLGGRQITPASSSPSALFSIYTHLFSCCECGLVKILGKVARPGSTDAHPCMKGKRRNHVARLLPRAARLFRAPLEDGGASGDARPRGEIKNDVGEARCSFACVPVCLAARSTLCSLAANACACVRSSWAVKGGCQWEKLSPCRDITSAAADDDDRR